MKQDNTQKITEIVMKPTACTFCKLGQDWYNNNLEITFTPDKYYPDYMDVQKYIMDEIDGHEMNIEDVVENVYSYMQIYEPKTLKVVDHVHGCKTHFDVDVTKE